MTAAAAQFSSELQQSMQPKEQLKAWRAEISAELEQFEQDLAGARKELADAEAAYETEAQSCDELAKFAGKGVGPASGMSMPLYSRLGNRRHDRLRELERPRGRARCRVRSLEQQIADHRLAIAQIDAALTADTVTQIPRPETVGRRKPVPIDYDTIQGAR